MSDNNNQPTTPVELRGGAVGVTITNKEGNVLHHSDPVDADKLNQKSDSAKMFTLFPGQKFDAAVMRVNTPKEKLYENIRVNSARMLEQLRPYEEAIDPVTKQPVVLALVGGGWSLAEPEVFEELRNLYFNGVRLVAINNAAKWLMERNLKPSMHIVLDARPENREFVEHDIPKCRVLLASQCDPTLFDAVSDERDLTIFHALAADSCVVESAILNAHYGEGRWMQIPACSSAGVTAILISRVLGYRYQHLFGIDSCYKSEQVHHAYPQALNDNEQPAWFRVGDEGRPFLCSPWQAAQARSFLDMVQHNHQHLELEVHGDGLLAYLLSKAATMPDNPSPV